MTKAILVGTGIFMWEGGERHSDRYGRFYFASETFNRDQKVNPTFNVNSHTLVGKKVRVWARVLENRKSGHHGDAHHQILPAKPAKNEIVELGVGYFDVGKNFEGREDVGLIPDDGRSKWWINAHKLYRLHDQTVEVFVEETEENFTPSAYPGNPGDGLAISNGDGSFQYKGDAKAINVLPQFENLGGGAFAFTTFGRNSPRGEVFKVRKTR